MSDAAYRDQLRKGTQKEIREALQSIPTFLTKRYCLTLEFLHGQVPHLANQYFKEPSIAGLDPLTIESTTTIGCCLLTKNIDLALKFLQTYPAFEIQKEDAFRACLSGHDFRTAGYDYRKFVDQPSRVLVITDKIGAALLIPHYLSRDPAPLRRDLSTLAHACKQANTPTARQLFAQAMAFLTAIGLPGMTVAEVNLPLKDCLFAYDELVAETTQLYNESSDPAPAPVWLKALAAEKLTQQLKIVATQRHAR